MLPVATDIVQFGAGVSGTISNVPNISIAGLVVTGGANITFTPPGAATNTLNITNGAAAVDFSITTGSTLTLGSNLNLSMANNVGGGIVGTFIINGSTFTTGGGNSVTNVSGVINNFGTVVSSQNGSLVFASGGTYIHSRNGGVVPEATWNVGSKTNITGITDAAPTGLGQSFGDFEWSNSQIADVNLNGGLQNVKGALKISKTSVGTESWLLNLGSTSNYTLTIGGDLSIGQTAPDSTNVSFINDGDGDAVINVAGNYLHGNGHLVFVDVNAAGNDGTATLNLAGNFVQSGGDIDFTSGDDGPVGQKGIMNIKGNFSHTGGTIRTTIVDPDVINGRINFNKTGIQTFTVTDPESVSYINFIISSGATLKLGSDLGINRDIEPNWIGNFTVNSGATLDASTHVVRSQIITENLPPADIPLAFANFNLAAGAKLITANANGVEGSINTANNLNASLNSGADYEFQGASTGAFTTTPLANTFRDLVVNNTTGNLTLAMPLTITRQLNLTSGLLTTTATNLPTIAAGGSASAATAASFVNGPLAKTGTTAFTFPVGKAGAGFRNIGITTPSGSSTFRAEFFRAAAPVGTLAPTLTRVSGCEYWDLSKTAGAAGVSARAILSWEANSPCNGAYVTDPTTLRVAHLLSGVWDDEGRLSSTGNNSAGTITSGDLLTVFSPFALGSSSGSANPLPVVFGDVKAYEKNGDVQIEWSNLTEKDVAEYTIERSADGKNFTAIARQWPTSNQNDKVSYTGIDDVPGTGANYYRIKVVETTGKIVYSQILSVDLGIKNLGLQLYPNPVTGHQVIISLSDIKRGQYTLRITNTAGQNVFNQTINSQGRTITQTLNLPSVIKPGVYHMTITGEGYHENKRFIIR